MLIAFDVAVILGIATWNTSRGSACGHKADDRQIVLGMGFTAPVTRPSEEIRLGCPHDLHTGRVGEPAIKNVTLPSHDLARGVGGDRPMVLRYTPQLRRYPRTQQL